MRSLLASALLACLAACGEAPVMPCRSLGSAHVICGVQNPEDLAAIPNDGDASAAGARFVIVSELGSIEDTPPGELALLDLTNEQLTPLFPQGGIGTPPQISEGPDWGDARCPGPPDQRLNPHGIDLARRPDGKRVLYVVNHGGREAVELFELLPSGRSYQLQWRGCVPMAQDVQLNDVAALPAGGFVTTYMFPRGSTVSALYWLVRGLLGGATGRVLQWRPGQALRVVPNTELAFPNGVQVSKDGRELFVGAYLSNELIRLSLDTGKRLGKVAIPAPDDITWSDTGQLLVASNVAGLSAMSTCMRAQGACPAAFEIVAVDPRSLHKSTLVHREGAPMGAASVAVTVGPDLLIGSFKSDRLLRLPRPSSAARGQAR